MIKVFILSACVGVFYSWTPALVDIYPAVAVTQQSPVSTHVTLLILGSCISALALWGKRPDMKE